MESRKNKNEMFGTFYLNDSEYALSVDIIQEVVNYPENIIAMPLAPEFLEGVFNLRGIVIPVMNLKKLLKLKNAEIKKEEKVVIANFNGAKIGILFDSTSEIIRPTEKEVEHFIYENENSKEVIFGAIKLDAGNRIIQLINIEKLINLENIPHIVQKQESFIENKAKKISSGIHGRCITFFVDEMKFAIDITSVREIIKTPKIDQSMLQDEMCLGIINVRGRTIPVFDFRALIASKITDEKEEESRIIILKSEKTVIGIKVNSVYNITSYEQKDMMSVPLMSSENSKMLKGCLHIEGLGDVFFVDSDKILNAEEVKSLSKSQMILCNDEVVENTVFKRFSRSSFITFRIDQLLAISIKEIREIINYSNEIHTVPGSSDVIKGFLNLRGKVITIVDARNMYDLGQEQIKKEDQKILIFEKDDMSYGLVVDKIESIITVDENNKIAMPSILTQNIHGRFKNDIKEIVSYKLDPQNPEETVMVVMNAWSISERLKATKAA